MAPGERFDAAAEDTEEALMAATYHALCKHGYADLTIERIGEQLEKSTSLLYHHYDGKDELLIEFLGYMLDCFEADVPFGDADDPWARLQHLLDHILAPTVDPTRQEFTSAIVELRAQAAHDPAYRDAFTRHDQFFYEQLTAIVREGSERGVFADVDPAAVAALVQTTFNGVILQRVTTADGGVPVENVRNELEASLVARLDPEESR